MLPSILPPHRSPKTVLWDEATAPPSAYPAGPGVDPIGAGLFRGAGLDRQHHAPAARLIPADRRRRPTAGDPAKATNKFFNTTRAKEYEKMKTLLTSAAAALALAASPAGADPLSLGATAGPVWNVAKTPNSVLLADGATGFSVVAKDSLGDLGSADFGKEMMEASSATPPIYPVVKQTLPGQSLTVSFGPAGQLSGDVVWADVTGGNPNFRGAFDYTAAGDPAFLALFGASGSTPIDLAATMTMMTLQQWDTTHGPIGLVGDPLSSVPEPTTLAMLGVGLLAFGLWRRRETSGSQAR